MGHVLDDSSTGIVVKNMDGEVLFVNAALCSMLRMKEEKLRSGYSVDFSPSDGPTGDWEIFQQLKNGLIDHYRSERRYLRGDSSSFWARIQVFLKGDRSSPFVVALIQEIPKQTPEFGPALSSEQQTMDVLTTLADLMQRQPNTVRLTHTAPVESQQDAIITNDSRGRIVSWNTSAERIFGYLKNEIMGKPDAILVPHALLSEHREIMEGLKKGHCCKHYETKRLTKYGETVDISLTIIPIRNSKQRLVGFSQIVDDISPRKKAEAALRESEQRFRLLADAMPMMIWMMGTDRFCTYVNRSWLHFCGRSLRDELGHGWSGGVHGDDVFRYFKTYTESCDNRTPFQIEYRRRRHDGEFRWILDIGVPRFNPDGSFAGYIGSCLDITERKLAEEALADIERKLIEAHEQERAWIARELHDDLIQRLALLAVELDQWTQEAPLEGHISMHLREAHRSIMDICTDAEALSRRLHSSKLDLLGLEAAARSFCKELSHRARVEVTFSLSELPTVLPKEVSLCLFRVMQEALQNAVKYSCARRFTVDMRGAPDSIELTVADDGVGFDESGVLAQSGLGLVSMKERLKMVHGEFQIRSQRGRGTTIFARVPVEVAAIQKVS